MNEMYELHRLYNKHEWEERGVVKSFAFDDYKAKVYRCSCGLYIWDNGKKRHLSCNSVTDIWEEEMKHSLQRCLLVFEAMQYRDFVIANREGLAQDPDAMGRGLSGDPLRYVDRAIKALDLFIEKHRGR